MSLWKFGRREPVCNACETAFEDGEKIWSRLRLGDEGLARHDVCWRCWKQPAEEGEIDVFWWRTRHTVGKKKGLSLNLPALEALFHSIDGRTEPTIRELRYLLCLLLMRKRRLKLVRVQRGAEGESFEVRRPRRQESLLVHVFDFTVERMDELRVELLALFDSAETDEVPEEGADADAAEGPVADQVPEGLEPVSEGEEPQGSSSEEPNGDPTAEASTAG